MWGGGGVVCVFVLHKDVNVAPQSDPLCCMDWLCVCVCVCVCIHAVWVCVC